MTRITASRLTSGATSGSPALELIMGILQKGVWIRRIEISLNGATASVYSLGRPQSKGITPTTPLRFLMEASADPVEPSTVDVTTALAWGTGPGVPAAYIRQAALPGNVGASTAWDFSNFWVPANGSVVLWNLQANATAYVNIVADI